MCLASRTPGAATLAKGFRRSFPGLVNTTPGTRLRGSSTISETNLTPQGASHSCHASLRALIDSCCQIFKLPQPSSRNLSGASRMSIAMSTLNWIMLERGSASNQPGISQRPSFSRCSLRCRSRSCSPGTRPRTPSQAVVALISAKAWNGSIIAWPVGLAMAPRACSMPGRPAIVRPAEVRALMNQFLASFFSSSGARVTASAPSRIMSRVCSRSIPAKVEGLLLKGIPLNLCLSAWYSTRKRSSSLLSMVRSLAGTATPRLRPRRRSIAACLRRLSSRRALSS